MLNDFDDKSIMPFGKHKGEALANVPASYLLFIYDNGYQMPSQLRKYIEDNMDVLHSQNKHRKK